VRHFLFQLKFMHAFSHYEGRKIYPNLPKSVEICPKTISLRNFEIPPKFEILIFFKKKNLYVEEALRYVLIVWIFNALVSHMPFPLSKNCLCMWISTYLAVENDFFLNVLLLLWVWDLVFMYLIQLGTRIWSSSIHIYFKKWFFWPPKLSCPPLA
jgi:hypothetical protein